MYKSIHEQAMPAAILAPARASGGKGKMPTHINATAAPAAAGNTYQIYVVT